MAKVEKNMRGIAETMGPRENPGSAHPDRSWKQGQRFRNEGNFGKCRDGAFRHNAHALCGRMHKDRMKNNQCGLCGR